jgi:hypothetical protein
MISKFIQGIFSDADGNYSSKRLVGFIASAALIIYMFVHPSTEANNSVLILAVSGLGLTTLDKIFKPKDLKNENKVSTNEKSEGL